MANPGVVVVIAGQDNTDKVFQQIEDNLNRMAQRTRLTENAAGEIGEKFGHALPQIAAASGAIRELEGNLPIRAVERFLTDVLGLGPALTKIFPLVGGIAFAGILKEGIDKIVEMKKEADGLGAAIRKAFDEAVSAERSHADQLAVTNDKLQQQLDKLEKRPNNGLELGLDEARVMADQLAESLEKDSKAVDSLFEKNKVSWLARLEGKQPIDDIKKQVNDALSQVDEVRRSYQETIESAIDGGASQGNIADIREAEMARLEGVYKKAEDTLKGRLSSLREQQKDFLAPFSSGQDHSAQISAVEGALELFRQQQRSIGEQFRNQTLAPKVSSAQAGSESAKVDTAVLNSRRRLDQSLLRLDEQQKSAIQQNARDAEEVGLAQLEADHKRQLISDESYYAQKLAIQQASLNKQQDAARDMASKIDDAIAGFQADKGKRAPGSQAALEDEGRISELQAKRLQVETEIARLQAKSGKDRLDNETAIYELQQKRLELSDNLAAAVEASHGNSVEARLKQNDDKYAIERQRIVNQFGADSPELGNADQIDKTRRDRIAASGPEETYNAQLATLNAQRSGVDGARARGYISAQQQQRQLIELNKQEADALQPVLEAYERLADEDGDLAATAKVASLKEKIAELSTPIDAVSLQIQVGFNSAFETLFTNLDQGSRAFENFGRSIERTISGALYKQFLETPINNLTQSLASQVTGKLSPGVIGTQNEWSKSGGGFSVGKALGGIFGGVASPLGSPIGTTKGAGTNITITLVNDSDNPLKIGDLAKQGGSELDKFEALVSQSFGSGGIMRQLLQGA